MEIPRDSAGYARPNFPRKPSAPAAPSTGSAAAAHRPLPPPVPVSTQVLPLSMLSEVRPRGRPAGLLAERGYGAALGIVRE